MAQIKVAEIVADINGVISFTKIVQQGRGSFSHKGLERAGQRYLRYLQNRYQTYAMGGGNWPALADSTKRKKKQNKEVILIEFMDLYGSLNSRVTGKNKVEVGVWGDHSYPRGRTVTQVAVYHQQGTSRMPRRKIIVRPPGGVQQGMRSDIEKGVNQDVNAVNRKAKNG